jgi:hypothetical protein
VPTILYELHANLLPQRPMPELIVRWGPRIACAEYGSLRTLTSIFPNVGVFPCFVTLSS